MPLIVATWRDREVEIAKLIDTLIQQKSRANFLALAPFQVNVFRHQIASFGQNIEVWHESDVRIWRGQYDQEIGLVNELPDEFIV